MRPETSSARLHTPRTRQVCRSVSYMTRHGFSKRLPEAAQVDYILFARADVALQPNADEVRAVRYVDAAALRDMMDPASGLRWSPWFRCEAGTRTAERGERGTRHLRCCCIHEGVSPAGWALVACGVAWMPALMHGAHTCRRRRRECIVCRQTLCGKTCTKCLK